jgi:hypothetical protein
MIKVVGLKNDAITFSNITTLIAQEPGRGYMHFVGLSKGLAFTGFS